MSEKAIFIGSIITLIIMAITYIWCAYCQNKARKRFWETKHRIDLGDRWLVKGTDNEVNPPFQVPKNRPEARKIRANTIKGES